MAAIGCHYARVGLVQVNALGVVVDKNNTSIKGMLDASSQHRVLPDVDNAPNSTGSPTIPDYVIAEAADGYIVGYMDQNSIVTYAAADM